MNCKEGPSFTYDYVYGEGATDPDLLYEQCVNPLVSGLFKGYNACCFAYGQTGSGKTYTMGSSAFSAGGSIKGVIPRVMESIFGRIAGTTDAEFTVRVGFVEIFNVRLLAPQLPCKSAVSISLHSVPFSRYPMLYDAPLQGMGAIILSLTSLKLAWLAVQEEIRDLLAPDQASAASVHIREVVGGGVCLAGAHEKDVTSRDEMAAVLDLVLSSCPYQYGSFDVVPSLKMLQRHSRVACKAFNAACLCAGFKMPRHCCNWDEPALVSIPCNLHNHSGAEKDDSTAPEAGKRC